MTYLVLGYPMAVSDFNQCPTYKGAKLRTRSMIG